MIPLTAIWVLIATLIFGFICATTFATYKNIKSGYYNDNDIFSAGVGLFAMSAMFVFLIYLIITSL